MAIALVIFGIGLILIIAAPIGKSKNNRCTAETQGTLIKIIETDSESGTGHAYIYSYYVNGIEYQIRSMAINANVRNVGDSCTIWYNPKNPKDAIEYRYESGKIFTVMLIIGIVLAVLGMPLSLYGCVRSDTGEQTSVESLANE